MQSELYQDSPIPSYHTVSGTVTDAVANPMELSYDRIRNLPSRTLVSYLECAGNHRAMFDLVQGRAADGTQWMTGAVGNGEWTGVPLRALLPGWVGSSSIKWLRRIVVSSDEFWTRNNTTSYVLISDDYPPEGEAEGNVVSAQTIKSALALPWPAELSAGSNRIHGYAHSPSAPISTVEWSADSGGTWNAATVLEPQVQYSWARFEFS